MSNMFLDYDGPILRRIEHLNTFASPYRLTLHKGAGYLYWEHPEVIDIPSVYSSAFSHLSTEAWLEELTSAIKYVRAELGRGAAR